MLADRTCPNDRPDFEAAELIDQIGFDAVGALEFPGGLGELVDEGGFDLVVRGPGFDQFSAEIGNRKARSFLLPRELGNHPAIQRLFDLRILHLVQRGYADKDRPGVRYNICTLDYGTYFDLMNTSKRPELGFSIETSGDPGDFIVPFDDKRSIRRIVLTEQILN